MANELNDRDYIQYLTKSLRPYLEVLFVTFFDTVHNKVANDLNQK